MRDNTWLENKMWEMLHNNFADVPVSNNLTIKFGRKAKQRLGSIRRRECVGNFPARGTSKHGSSLLAPFILKSRVVKSFGFRDPGSSHSASAERSGMTLRGGKQEGKGASPSLITITGHFKDLKVPEYVVLATIAHELVHYAHGFSSPLEQKSEHPHRGGIVKKELEKRELGEIQQKADKWLKESWVRYLKTRV